MPHIALLATEAASVALMVLVRALKADLALSQVHTIKLMRTRRTSEPSLNRSSIRRLSYGPSARIKMAKSELALKEMHSCQDLFTVNLRMASLQRASAQEVITLQLFLRVVKFSSADRTCMANWAFRQTASST